MPGVGMTASAVPTRGKGDPRFLRGFMRILLIATNRHRQLMSRMNARPAPIGLAYIAGYLDPDRHKVEVLDLMFSEDYLADTEARVREFQPDLVGISLRNLDNSSYMDPQWALPTTKEVIDKVRSKLSYPPLAIPMIASCEVAKEGVYPYLVSNLNNQEFGKQFDSVPPCVDRLFSAVTDGMLNYDFLAFAVGN